MGRLKLGNALETTASADPARRRHQGRAAAPEPYEPVTATPTDKLKQLMVFRAVHPLYGMFLMDHLGKADPHELIQILESLLAMPGTVAKSLRVPWPDVLPPGRLSLEVVDPAILTSGLATHDDLYPQADQSDVPARTAQVPGPAGAEDADAVREHDRPCRRACSSPPVWAVGDLLAHGGDFDKFVRAARPGQARKASSSSTCCA